MKNRTYYLSLRIFSLFTAPYSLNVSTMGAILDTSNHQVLSSGNSWHRLINLTSLYPQWLPYFKVPLFVIQNITADSGWFACSYQAPSPHSEQSKLKNRRDGISPPLVYPIVLGRKYIVLDQKPSSATQQTCNFEKVI